MEKDLNAFFSHKGYIQNAFKWSPKMDLTFNHHMKLFITSPCQVSELGEKGKLHDGNGKLHVGCYSSPPPTQDLVPRSKPRTKRGTQIEDGLHAPKWPPSQNDVTTAPS